MSSDEKNTEKQNKIRKQEELQFKEYYLRNALEESWTEYQEKRQHERDEFSKEVDPINILFKFYGLILLITIFIALMVFIAILIFGKVSLFGLIFFPSIVLFRKSFPGFMVVVKKLTIFNKVIRI